MARTRLDMRPVFAHPLFVVTFIISSIGFFAAFIGQAVLEAKYHEQGHSGTAAGVQWFGVFLQMFLNLRILHTLGTDAVAHNQIQICTFLGVSLVFAVLGVNSGIFASTSSQLALGAGWLLIAVVDILWLAYFTSEDDAFFVALFDSGARASFARPALGLNPRQARQAHNPSARGSNAMSNNGAAISYTGAYSNNLGSQGLKSASLGHGSLGGHLGGGGGGDLSVHDEGARRSPTIGGESLLDGNGGGGQEYALKARALYSYTASPDDPNEISFAKGEILDIVDNSGKWWQARKADGNTRGIVPSNYLVLC